MLSIQKGIAPEHSFGIVTLWRTARTLGRPRNAVNYRIEEVFDRGEESSAQPKRRAVRPAERESRVVS